MSKAEGGTSSLKYLLWAAPFLLQALQIILPFVVVYAFIQSNLLYKLARGVANYFKGNGTTITGGGSIGVRGFVDDLYPPLDPKTFSSYNPQDHGTPGHDIFIEKSRPYAAVDYFTSPLNAPVYVIDDGSIINVRFMYCQGNKVTGIGYGRGGTLVEIKHPSGSYSYYAHIRLSDDIINAVKQISPSFDATKDTNWTEPRRKTRRVERCTRTPNTDIPEGAINVRGGQQIGIIEDQFVDFKGSPHLHFQMTGTTEDNLRQIMKTANKNG